MPQIRYDAADLAGINAFNQVNGNRFDDAASMFLAQELNVVKSHVYSVERTGLSALDIFPVTNEIPSFAKTFTVTVVDGVTMAKIIADYSDDLPIVGTGIRQETGQVYRLGNGYYYTIDDILASIATGRSLSTRLGVLARQGHDLLNNTLVWKGDADRNIIGIFDHPNIPHTVSAGWTTAEIAYGELNAGLASIETITKNLHRATDIVIPPSVNRILNTNMPNTSVSYRAYFNQINPSLVWNSAPELEDWNGSGQRAVLFFEKSPVNLSIEIPEAFNQLPPQAENLKFKVPCTSKSAGLNIYLPLTLNLLVGV